jgi:hypothetical protein
LGWGKDCGLVEVIEAGLRLPTFHTSEKAVSRRLATAVHDALRLSWTAPAERSGDGALTGAVVTLWVIFDNQPF